MSHGHWISNTWQKGTHWFTVDDYFLPCVGNINIAKWYETKSYTSCSSHRVALWSLHAKKKGLDNTNGKKVTVHIVCINTRIYAWSLHALRQPAWGQQVIQSAPPFLPFDIPLFPPFLLLTLSFSFRPLGVCQTPPLGWNFDLFLLFFASVYMCNIVFL